MTSYIQEHRGLVCQYNFSLDLSSARIQKFEKTDRQTFYYYSSQKEAGLLPKFSLDSLLIEAEFEVDANLSMENCSTVKGKQVMHVSKKKLLPLH